ncbi:Shedu anti-phage system protein SduA domain-containing protein [Amycolatopsis sp. NPDC089917]|uniref:Shedu anti-phage system protein SduA domain-containing protein n=1 Tax=Amycolatopsis sp. NPDC089917 TaxID=3155187 RepID=UPI00343B90A0
MESSTTGDDFTIWVAGENKGPGQLGATGAVLKQGPQVCKTVTLSTFGDEDTQDVRRRELCFRSFPRHPTKPGFDFSNPQRRWSCENDEIVRLVAFLEAQVSEKGRFRVVDTASPTATLLMMLERGEVDPTQLVTALQRTGDLEQLARAIAATNAGISAVREATLTHRRQLVAELQQLVRQPTTTETDLQRKIEDAYWLFGGRYVGVASRRNLVPLDQHDIPLLSADGTLHIVELKGPVIPKLVHPWRNHHIVGNDVHEATSQAMNYLRGLDETGATLTTAHLYDQGVNYDLRRVHATVVIGHPDHLEAIDERVVNQTIRSYNAHLSRVEVITYKDLFDVAERALTFEEAEHNSKTTTRPAA